MLSRLDLLLNSGVNMRAIFGMLLLLPISALGMEFVVKNQQGKVLEDVVVEIIGQSENANQSAHSITQKNYQFNPDVLIARVGDTVDFPNQDPVSHHVYSFSQTKFFELPLHGAGTTTNSITLDQAGIVELGCNIHDSMQGFIYVSQSTLVGETNRQGILDLDTTATKATKANIRLWHPRMNAPEVQSNVQLNGRSVVLMLNNELTPEKSSDYGGYAY